MTHAPLEERFAAYLIRDDDALTGSQLFEILAEIERRRVQETIEVTLRLINRQAQCELSDKIRTQGNVLWVGDKRIVVRVAE